MLHNVIRVGRKEVQEENTVLSKKSIKTISSTSNKENTTL